MKAQMGASKDGTDTSTSLIQSCQFGEAFAEQQCIELAVIGSGSLVVLSDLLPMVENLGVEVLTSSSHADKQHWQVKLRLRPQAQKLLTSKPMQAQFSETLLAISQGAVDNDGFNKLITLCGLELRSCVLLRAIGRYLLQINLPFSLAYMEATLCRHPDVATAIAEFFGHKFNPSSPISEQQLTALRAKLDNQIEAVESIDDDRILNSFIDVIEAMVRTNFFRDEVWSDHQRCLAFKLLPAKIAMMPKPAPAFEIFVFGPEVEGVHLRGGKVARGGLRWSERMEDYRTEVLGLVKAQMVKNAVIVPTGAKGGFICKTLQDEADPELKMQQVRHAYSAYIRALLDLTDNRVDGSTVPPTNVVRYDGDDAYLVVAADKGTATFSDTANEIACRAGFWLGDAFASGGSHGYDHKKMGITARGAWESTKRLFKELGHDTQTAPFTVAGIGDMSGDVFGNGMLLSNQILLVAAFNHRHIFIDPNPAPQASFNERQRLFKLPRSGWNDYNSVLISQGGGVFERTSKKIPLTPQIRQRLGLADSLTQLSPDELIRAILRAEVDLIWNGGIGTYVRASHERDQDVGDRATDSVRVAAAELRAKVVVEGGNLGLTQQARIEFARCGGLINTDAVDNSAGVDCSDHEVNIKILLNPLVDAGRISAAERDRILDAMTDEVSELVLRNNYQQSKMLSQSNQTASAFIAKHGQLIQLLEREGRLDRQLEQLPDDAEIEQRIANKEGLTRPEIAVLLAYSKSRLFEQLIETDVIDDTKIAEELFRYFPQQLHEEYRSEIASHPLRKEILAAQLTNQVMNRMGSTFSILLLEDVQTNCGQWIRSYTVAREALGVSEIVKEIDEMGFLISNQQQMALQLQIHHPLEKATHWLLKNADWSMQTPAIIDHFKQAIGHTREQLNQLQPGQTDEAAGEQSEAPLTTTQSRVGALEFLYYGFDIAKIAATSQRDLSVATAAFFALNSQLQLFWLRREIDLLPAFDRWHRKAKQALLQDLDAGVLDNVVRIIAADPSLNSFADFSAFIAKSNVAGRLKNLVSEIKSEPSRNLAMVTFVVNKIREI
ncbi:MAG: NAD-glutamate dehydrogenase domain-containing protein [Halopseudomonas sp.]